MSYSIKVVRAIVALYIVKNLFQESAAQSTSEYEMIGGGKVSFVNSI